jgi:S1-C subfamily serine protease
MYLEPNAEFSEPFAADTSGLILGTGGADLRTITVLHVLGGTPAALTGIKIGDAIVTVNGEVAWAQGMEGKRSLFV